MKEEEVKKMAKEYEDYPWGTCLYGQCVTIEVRCVMGFCKAHCATEHKDLLNTLQHPVRTTAEEERARPNYTPKPPKLVAVHKFLEEVA